MVWGIEKIKTILPQREPFLFIDEVIEIQGTQKVIAVKNIKGSESFFKGHFPNRPIMPGVLIIEAMAQASVILYYLNKPEIAKTHPSYYLGKIKSEFLSPVFPGDRLVLEAINIKIIDNACVIDTNAFVENKTVARANLVISVKQNE